MAICTYVCHITWEQAQGKDCYVVDVVIYFKTRNIYVSLFSSLGSPRSRRGLIRCLMRAPSRFTDGPLPGPHAVESREKQALRTREGTNPVYAGRALMPSSVPHYLSRLHLLMPSHWRACFQHVTFDGIQISSPKHTVSRM